MHQIELPIIEVLQNIFKVLQPVWLAITFLGDETFYLLFMPMIYWCVDALAGLRIGIVLIFSSFLNGFLKMIFKSPRPFWVSDRIEMTAHHDSFGLPSGHALDVNVPADAARDGKSGARIVRRPGSSASGQGPRYAQGRHERGGRKA